MRGTSGQKHSCLSVPLCQRMLSAFSNGVALQVEAPCAQLERNLIASGQQNRLVYCLRTVHMLPHGALGVSHFPMLLLLH